MAKFQFKNGAAVVYSPFTGGADRVAIIADRSHYRTVTGGTRERDGGPFYTLESGEVARQAELQPVETLPVIFRAERSGDFKGEVTAVFPTLPHDTAGRYFTTYAHVGQHGSGSHAWYNGTRAATDEESADLLRELRGIYERSHGDGDSVYRLIVARRYSAPHRAAFAAEVRRMAAVDRALVAREKGESVPLGTLRSLPESVRELARSRPCFTR